MTVGRSHIIFIFDIHYFASSKDTKPGDNLFQYLLIPSFPLPCSLSFAMEFTFLFSNLLTLVLSAYLSPILSQFTKLSRTLFLSLSLLQSIFCEVRTSLVHFIPSSYTATHSLHANDSSSPSSLNL